MADIKHNGPWWVRLKTQSKPVPATKGVAPYSTEPEPVRGMRFCIDGGTKAEATAIAQEYGELAYLDPLPYPAAPRIPGPNGGSSCPSFCYAPDRCKGRTACPQSYACSE